MSKMYQELRDNLANLQGNVTSLVKPYLWLCNFHLISLRPFHCFQVQNNQSR